MFTWGRVKNARVKTLSSTDSVCDVGCKFAGQSFEVSLSSSVFCRGWDRPHAHDSSSVLLQLRCV